MCSFDICKVSLLVRSARVNSIRILSILCVASALSSPALGLQEATGTALNVHHASGAVRKYNTFPGTTVKLLFPTGEAFVDRDAELGARLMLPERLSKRVEFVKVSDPQRRFTIAGAIYGNQLFMFAELFCADNTAVMSQLMRATGTSPESPDQALALAKLYLSLSYYGLREPVLFIVSSADDLPKETVPMPNENFEDVREVLHAPRAVPAGSGYEVELFATDLDMPRVHRWQMKIGPTGLQDVTDQRVYPNYREMRDLYSRAKSATLAQPEKVELWHCCFMANGRTEDGATTDLQMWAASNGPFVSRTHYYYDSDEKAAKLMERFLKDAIAVIENGPWLDTEGKVAGKRALVILAGHEGALAAAELFEDGSSVLELSSLCLRSLLAVKMKPREGKGASDSLQTKLDCPDRANAVAFSVDGKLIAAGYGWRDEGGVRVWNLADRSIIHDWISTKTPDSSDMIRQVAFSPDGKLFAAATWDGDIFLFDSTTWNEPTRIPLQAGAPTALTFSSGSDLLAFSTDKAVILYEIKTAKVTKLATAQGVPQRFIEAGFLADGKTLVFCDFRTLQFWDIVANKSTSTPLGNAPVFFCEISPQGHYIITGGGAVYGKKLVEVWKVGDSSSPAQITGFRNGLFASGMSHSEELMAFGGVDYGSGGDMVVWKTGETQELGHVTTGKFPIENIAFSPDDSLLAAASHDGAVFIYTVEQLRSAPGGPSHH